MAEEVESTKPVCGGGEEVGEYDLPLHVAALCKSYTITLGKEAQGKYVLTNNNSLGVGCLHPRSWLPCGREEDQVDEHSAQGLLLL